MAELDAQVVERALSGDAAAVRQLVDAHQDAMLNVAFRITGSAEASWDIAREVFVRLLEHPASVAGREGQISRPLYHGVVALAVRRDVTTAEVPRDDRAVEAVAETALGLPANQRAALALGDHLGLDAAGIAASMGTTPGAAAELLTASRLALAKGLGIRGRDPRLVEREAARLYGLWPAMESDELAPDVLRDARQRGLVFGPSGHSGRWGGAGRAGGGPVIGGVRITPAMGLLLLAVPLLLAAAIAVAVRSGGGDDDPPAVTSPLTGLTDTAPVTDPLFPATAPTTRTTTRSTTSFPVSTVSTGGTPGGGGAPDDGGDDGDGGGGGTPEPEPAPATTSQAPPATTEAPPVTREPGGGAPPRPTTSAAPPRPATTSGGGGGGGGATTGGAQPPPPTGGSQVPLP